MHPHPPSPPSRQGPQGCDEDSGVRPGRQDSTGHLTSAMPAAPHHVLQTKHPGPVGLPVSLGGADRTSPHWDETQRAGMVTAHWLTAVWAPGKMPELQAGSSSPAPQAPLSGPYGPRRARRGVWGAAAGSFVGLSCWELGLCTSCPAQPSPTPLAMGTVGKPRHGLFADSCLLTACPKPCVKQPQMAPALRCFPSTRGFCGNLERVPPTRKSPPRAALGHLSTVQEYGEMGHGLGQNLGGTQNSPKGAAVLQGTVGTGGMANNGKIRKLAGTHPAMAVVTAAPASAGPAGCSALGRSPSRWLQAGAVL